MNACRELKTRTSYIYWLRSRVLAILAILARRKFTRKINARVIRFVVDCRDPRAPWHNLRPKLIIASRCRNASSLRQASMVYDRDRSPFASCKSPCRCLLAGATYFLRREVLRPDANIVIGLPDSPSPPPGQISFVTLPQFD